MTQLDLFETTPVANEFQLDLFELCHNRDTLPCHDRESSAIIVEEERREKL